MLDNIRHIMVPQTLEVFWMEEKIVEDQRIIVLDLSLEDTPARWWDSHKAVTKNWEDADLVI
jgi:hypothetical protein